VVTKRPVVLVRLEILHP
jgi:hypothetical protein